MPLSAALSGTSPGVYEKFPLVELSDRLVRCVRANEKVIAQAELETRPLPPRPSDGGIELTVEGLSSGYGASLVLHDVALRVPTEQCLAVVGESGSGKTTLARCIVGLHAQWEGPCCTRPKFHSLGASRSGP